MKKTLRKAVAVLLSVLMIVCSVPFTALADTDTKGWWSRYENTGGAQAYDTSKNPDLLKLLQEREDGTYIYDDYSGWNDENGLAMGFGLGDTFQPGDWGYTTEALNMIHNEYMPTLTVSVWDQGTADNRIWRQFYGYATSASATPIDYDTAVSNGYRLDPTNLKAGQRIAVVFELGGFDAIYSCQIRGYAETDALSFSYYRSNPTSKDQWYACTDGTTQPYIMRALNIYGSAVTDNTGCGFDKSTGVFLTPFYGGNDQAASQYVGPDVRGFGEHGVYMCAVSFEVLKDCDLTKVLHMDVDPAGQETRFMCVWSPFAWDETGLGQAAKFTFQTDAESVHESEGLIALNWDNYPIASDCTHEASKITKHDAQGTCAVAGTPEYYECSCGKLFSTGTPVYDTDGTTITGYTVKTADIIDAVPTAQKEPTIHTTVQEKGGDKATCASTGTDVYYQCDGCSNMYSSATPVYGDDGTTPINYKVDETTLISEIPTTVKDTTNHTSVSKVEGSAATCSSTGTKDSYKCAGCGNVYTEATAIYADDGETITGWTVTESSKITSDADLDIPIVDTAHKWGAWTEAGTDAETGNYIHTRTCELNANHTETADCTWGELITDTAATEKTKGAGHYVCTECGQVKSVVLDELPCDHAAAQEVTKVDAKCDSIGREAYWTCPTCGKNFTDSTFTVQVTDLTTLDIPAIEHKNAQLVEATPATCTSTGIVAHYHCPDCGLDFTDATCTTELADTTAPIVDTAHSWGAWSLAGKNAEGTYIHTRTCAYNTAHTETANCTFGELQVVEPATETKEGAGYYECTDCGQTYDYVIPVKDCAHASMEPHARVEATCAKEGNIAYWYCPTCDKYFSDAEGNVEITQAQTVIAIVADAHSWSDWSSNNDGTHSRTCSNEGCPVGTETADCTMKETSAQVDPTCEGYGTTAIETCEVCSYQTGGTSINPIEHSWLDWAADEGADTHTRVCANDANHTQTVAHNWVETSAQVNPTCTEAGKTAVYTCSDCQATKGGETINATEHSWGAWTAVEGTDTHTRTCSNANCPIGTQTEAHNWVETAAEVPATFDAAGTTAAYACSDCGATKGGEPIAQLESWTIAVEASEYGTSTLNKEDSSAGLSMKVAKDSTVTLTAAPVEGCEFVGWKLQNKIVSDQATYSFTAIANATYTPVFTESINNTFTVVFVDAFGNIIASINAVDNADLVAQADAIEPPVMPGKAFTGWSEDLSTITAGTTVYAQYSTDASALYTVTATGCTITDENGNIAQDVMENVPYDTKVTVSANSGTAAYWTLDGNNDIVLSYDAEYSFYVGANITVVPVITGDVVAATPTVTAVSTSEVTNANGLKKAMFLASRSMTDGYTYVASGFIYGKAENVNADTKLADVNGTTVKRAQTSTDCEQFSLTYGLSAQSGSVAAVAYLTVADSTGKTTTYYAPFTNYTYA